MHNRLEYLKNLIESLSAVSEINKSLLIFSHDYYDTEINNVIHSIKFARVFTFFVNFFKENFLGNSNSLSI